MPFFPDPIVIAHNIQELQEYYKSNVFQIICNIDTQFKETLCHGESITGFCHICQAPSTFKTDPSNSNCKALREMFQCHGCNLHNRHRTLLIPIIKLLDQPEHKVVWIGEHWTPMTDYLIQKYQHKHTIITSQFDPDPSIRHENIEQLLFNDNSIDLIITGDVMEHVNNPESAWAECFRVLTPGGQNIFTVPVHLNGQNSITRCKLVNGVIEHYEAPPQWHGPEGHGGFLAFTDFKFDILDTNKNHGYQEVNVEYYWSPDMMIRGSAMADGEVEHCIFRFVK